MSTPGGDPMRGPGTRRSWWAYAPPQRTFTSETKPFFLTSEFLVYVLLLMGLGIATGTSDNLNEDFFWIATTVATAFYMLSRGIAKSGSISRARDPREDIGKD